MVFDCSGMLYGSMMGNYNGLYLPMMNCGLRFSAPFTMLTTVHTPRSTGRGDPHALRGACAGDVGVFALLMFWKQAAGRVNHLSAGCKYFHDPVCPAVWNRI